MVKIAIWSNSPWSCTGYGGQVRNLAPRLQKMGHEVCVIANFGLSGSSINWNGIRVYPLREARQNADVIGTYVEHFNSDIVLSLYDVWAFPPDSRKRMGVPWVALTPVDGGPISDQQKKRLETVDYIVAYSRYGQRQIKEAGFECDYVPHAIDTDLFKPGDKAQARQELGFPQDRYVVSIVAANKGWPARKAWAEMLTGFKRFQDAHPEALLYCHTTKEPFGSSGQGIYFDPLRKQVGIPDGAIAFPTQGNLAIGVPDEQIASIYQASDVLLLASMGEGFGLPIVEAQACGCPVITQDCSAMSELTCNGIALEPLQPLWVPQLGYWWRTPSIERITEGLEQIYSWPEDHREQMSKKGIEFVRENYSWPVVWERYWEDFIQKVEETLW